MAWQPIETAPKDGTAILVYGKKGIGVREWLPYGAFGHWSEPNVDGHDLDDWLSGKSYYSSVTHWMPLPETPNAH